MELKFDEKDYKIFSANEIRTYCDCARKRYYSSRSCLALKSNKPAENLFLGSEVHKYLQFLYENSEDPFIDMEAKNYETPADLSIDNQKVFNCIKENYITQALEDLEKYQVIGCEVPFSIKDWPLEGVLYHGLIDMIVQDKEDGKYYFFEHKTCKDYRPLIYNRFDIQLHIYTVYGYQYVTQLGLELDQFGGIILNEIKKAKTNLGFGINRTKYFFNLNEVLDFQNWLAKKTKGAISEDNDHEPCNNYMTCKLCEYADICMKYGYEIPKDTNEIIDQFGEQYLYDPREEQSNED